MKKKGGNFKALRVLSLILCLVLAFCAAATDAVFTWQNTLNRYMSLTTGKTDGESGSAYYTSDYSTIERLFDAKRNLCIEIGEEGCVLLKNENNALPVAKNAKISVFGRNSTDFVVGTSSGGGKISGDDDLKTVFSSVGLKLNDKLWNYYSNTEANKRKSSGQGIRIGELDPSKYPADVTGSYSDYSDAAFVVISRNFGEGHDVPLSTATDILLDSDGTHYVLQLHDYERGVIEEAKKCSDKVIVLINSDNVMEIGELKNDPDVDAILQVGGTGVYGLYGVANVITGKVSPSGHLVDTYAASNLSSPAAQNYGDFSFTNSDHSYVVYQEGIYVGYKYYETRYEDSVLGQGNADSKAGVTAGKGNWSYTDEMVYPFGYGLSYSEFTQEITDVIWDEQNRTVTATVEVTNVGDYDAKDVVQLYVQTPYTDYDKENHVEKAAVQLIGFAKTETLEAGGGQETVTVTASLDHVASFDYTNAKTYILDYGRYYFATGNGAHDALNNILSAKGFTAADGMDYEGNTKMVLAYDHSGSGEIDAQTCAASVYTGETITNQLDSTDLNYYGDFVSYLSRQDWEGTWTGPVSVTATDEMITLLNEGSSYSVDSANNDLSNVQEGVNYGSAATSVNFFDLNGKEYDDPIWEDALNQLTLDEMTRIVGLANSGVISSINMPEYLQFDGPLGIVGTYKTNKLEYAVSATQYPTEPMWAGTFSHTLADRIGKMFGNDGLWTGYQCVWGPGCDTHRTPFCGRNAEYFSEDGVMAFHFAKDMSLAAREYGLSCGPKHFALNDQEVNRDSVATFANEQAVREIYLRAFEGPMAAGGALDAMCGKNHMGCLPASATAGLLQGIVEDEWGYRGAIISDSSEERNGSGAFSVIAGLTEFDTMSRDYITGSGSLAPEKIKNDAVLFEAMREACHRNLYLFANTSLINNLSSDTTISASMAWYQITMLAITGAIGAAALASFVLMIKTGKLKTGIKQSKKGRICTAAGILCSLLGIILYMITTVKTNGEMSILILAVSAAGTLLALLSLLLFHLDGIFSMISAPFLLYSMCMFISSQADNIGYAAAGIGDIGYGIQTTLIIGCILYLIAIIGESIAVFDKNN